MKKLSNYPIIQLSNYPIIQLSKKINWFSLAGVCVAFVLFSTTSCKKELLTDEELQATPQLREKPGRDCLKPINPNYA